MAESDRLGAKAKIILKEVLETDTESVEDVKWMKLAKNRNQRQIFGFHKCTKFTAKQSN
jgi:hypothetical protein